MAHVLVTGSAGFIGGYLVEELLHQGHHVTGLDNHSKYGPVTRSYDTHPHYTFIKGDAQDTTLLTQLAKTADHLIAAAAMIGGISYFHTYAYDLLNTNERIMAATCDAAITAHHTGQLQKCTYISSSMVYENTTTWPSTEGDELTIPPPTSSYGFQKLAVEYWARAAWQQHQLPYTIIRPFNCVGIGEARAKTETEIPSGNITLAMSHVVPDLIQKTLKGQNPLHILGDGNQTRHYTYGGDLAKGITLTLNHPKAHNNDYNLSTNQSTTVLQLAQTIWHKIHGPHTPFQYTTDPPFPHDVTKRIPNTTKAATQLGFHATTTLHQMLDKVIPWIQQAIKDGTI